jgi:L-fuconate dehydratase
MNITKIAAQDRLFKLEAGAGSDAVHSDPVYSFAVTRITLDSGLTGTGLVLTMGRGNDLVCGAIELLGQQLSGRNFEELMADFGSTFRRLADDVQLRWLGPHKEVVHLALASTPTPVLTSGRSRAGCPYGSFCSRYHRQR